MKHLVAVFGISSLLLMSGCASILTDKISPVQIGTSNGEQTTVIVDGQKYQAPGVVYFRKNGTDKIVRTQPNSGCTDQTTVHRKIEDEFWINIIFGVSGVFASATDAATDKMWGYEDSVIINCQ